MSTFVLDSLNDLANLAETEAIQTAAMVAEKNELLARPHLVEKWYQVLAEVGMAAGKARKLARVLWFLDNGSDYQDNGKGIFKSCWLLPEMVGLYNRVRPVLRDLYKVCDWLKPLSELIWSRTWSRVFTTADLGQRIDDMRKQVVKCPINQLPCVANAAEVAEIPQWAAAKAFPYNLANYNNGLIPQLQYMDHSLLTFLDGALPVAYRQSQDADMVTTETTWRQRWEQRNGEELTDDNLKQFLAEAAELPRSLFDSVIEYWNLQFLCHNLQ